MKKFVFLFPGQGAQAVGMMKDFYDTFPESRAVFEEAEDVLKTSLTRLIFEGPKESLTQTVNCQPAIFVASYAVYAAFHKRAPEIKPFATAGLSLGEYTALVAGGRASFKDVLPIVQKRALLMQQACEAHKSSMQVVLGQEETWVFDQLKASGLPVWVANLNCPGQVVIAGELEPLAKAADYLKAQGAKRVLPLDVSGAFHTPLMQSAQKGLSPYLEKLHLNAHGAPLVMNALGASVTDNAQIRHLLIEQVTSPVLWAKGIASLPQDIEAYIEMGPGSTLAGMNKRCGVTAPTYSLQSVEDLSRVLNQLEVNHVT